MTYFLFAILLLLLFIRRQLTPKPIKRSLYTFPVLLFIYGLYLASNAGVETAEGVSLILGASLGIIVGVVQGRFTRVYEQNGIWMVSGSFWSLAIWLLSIPIRYMIKFGFIQLLNIPIHLTGEYAFVPFLFSLAGIIAGRTLYLAFKYPNEFRQGTSISRSERKRITKSNRTL